MALKGYLAVALGSLLTVACVPSSPNRISTAKSSAKNDQRSLTNSAAPAFAMRPLRKTLEITPFGDQPYPATFGLLAPPGLPFSTYVPIDSGPHPLRFTSQPVQVGSASGIRFGDLADHQMITEAVFLPPGTTWAQAIKNLQLGEQAFSKAPWRLSKFRETTGPGLPAWALREDTTDPHDEILGTADLGRYRDQYFYIIRTGWYEADSLPIMQEWEWADGRFWDQSNAGHEPISSAGPAYNGVSLPVPSDFQKVSVSFPDSDHGWILLGGSPATVQQPWALVYTGDAGRVWHILKESLIGPPTGPFPSNMFVLSMAFRNDSDGIIVALDNLDRGGILYTYLTKDGGLNWSVQTESLSLSDQIFNPFVESGTVLTQPIFSDARDVSFKSLASIGAQLIFRSRDGGETWRFTAVQPPPDFESLRMVNDRIGWATTRGEHIRYTADGGADWVEVTPSDLNPPVGPAVALEAIDSDHAWLAFAPETSQGPGPILVYRTSNGGRSWQGISTTIAGEPWIQFLNDRTGFILVNRGAAAGEEGVTLLRSDDGGASWQTVMTASPATPENVPVVVFGNKNGFGFANAQDGYLTGFMGGAGILFDATRDGGRTWQGQRLPIPRGYFTTDDGGNESQPPVFFNSRDGILAVRLTRGSGKASHKVLVFYATDDGGRTWIPTSGVPDNGHDRWSFADFNHGMVTDGTVIYCTTDGGRRWIRVNPNVSLKGISKLDFITPDEGWAIVHGGLLKTTDGGKIWTDLSKH